MVLETVVDFWALTSTLAYTEGGRVNSVAQGGYLSEAIVLAMLASHHGRMHSIYYKYICIL